MKIPCTQKYFKFLMTNWVSFLRLPQTNGKSMSVAVIQRQNDRPMGGISWCTARAMTTPMAHVSTVAAIKP
jgi:hypothetical protein